MGIVIDIMIIIKVNKIIIKEKPEGQCIMQAITKFAKHHHKATKLPKVRNKTGMRVLDDRLERFKDQPYSH